jgi:hypothetical protein
MRGNIRERRVCANWNRRGLPDGFFTYERDRFRGVTTSA